MAMLLPPRYRFRHTELCYKMPDGQLVLTTHDERRLVRLMHAAWCNNDRTRFNHLTEQLRLQREVKDVP